MTIKISNYPEEEGEERAIEFLASLGKASSGGIPVLGSFIAEAIDFFYKRPVEKRREDWMDEFVNAFNDLSKIVDSQSIGKLAENEEFITVLHRATDIALRTHQKDKRLLLRNAIVSAGSPTAPELDKQIFFLRMIDELTINQILVLLLYKDPIEWFKSHNIQPTKYSSAPRTEVLLQAYPNIARSPYVNELVLNGLESRGLLSGLTGMVSGDSVYAPMTSKLAIEFIEYIKAEKL